MSFGKLSITNKFWDKVPHNGDPLRQRSMLGTHFVYIFPREIQIGLQVGIAPVLHSNIFSSISKRIPAEWKEMEHTEDPQSYKKSRS